MARRRDCRDLREVGGRVGGRGVGGGRRGGRSLRTQSSGTANQRSSCSVAAAMALYHADAARRAAGVGELSESERERLEADFSMRAVRHAEQLLARSEKT